MNDNQTPMDIDNENAPFTGPDPSDDKRVSTEPATDDSIDAQEYYDEGLAGAAELNEVKNGDDEEELPDGFHVV